MPIQTVSQAFTNEGAGGFTFRNRIINGAMTIDQRNAGASVTPTTNQYTLDRWRSLAGGASSKYSVQQNAGSVTPPAGFTNYFGVTSLSAYSVSASDYQGLVQKIEGYNVADLGWGSANAKTVTLSFWVRSSLTGTFGGAIGNAGHDRSYPFTYTISAANTWTQISVTIAGDTTGTWLTDNSVGIQVFFGLGVGSSASGTAGAWASAQYFSATGATSVVGTNGATFYITGVQLEVGSVATPFERRPYTTELALCQRYYYLLAKSVSGEDSPIGFGSYTNSGAGVRTHIVFPTTMRIAPSIVCSSVANVFSIYINDNDTFQTFTLMNSSERAINLYVSANVSGTAGDAGPISSIETGAFLAFDAEL